jgi:hypothetical protein
VSRRLLILSFVALCVVAFNAAQANPPPKAEIEIQYLLQYVETSGCAFYRNGAWYKGSQAKAHLLTKYNYLVARNLVSDAEDFIDKGASKSSLSGEPYKIRCGTGPEIESRKWFRDVLARYRAPGSAPPAEPHVR